MTKKRSRVAAGRILVVDDHAAARESVADVLRHAGYEVECSASAVELTKNKRDTADIMVTKRFMILNLDFEQQAK